MKTFLLSFILLLICFNYSVSQSNNFKNVVPPSPTAASLGQYADIPVSQFAGLPNISIPLYNVRSGGLTLPITASYHGGGIKVAEEASWLGLGWSLNAGGVITRSMSGGDDFGQEGLMNLRTMGYAVSSYEYPNFTDSWYGMYYYAALCTMVWDSPWFDDPDHSFITEEILMGNADIEPDQFFFNFGNYSGKFFFQRCVSSQQNCDVLYGISQDKNDLQIAYYVDDRKWIITDGSGIKYYFEVAEKTQVNSNNTGPYLTEDEIPNAGSLAGFITTSWYLTKIESPSGDDNIELQYTTGNHISKGRPSYSVTRSYLYPGMNEATWSYGNSQALVQEKYLSKIVFEDGYVDFVTSNRTDMSSPSEYQPLPPQKLDQIKVSDPDGNLLQSIVMNNSYFQKTGQENNPSYARLKLDDIQINPGSTASPRYLFTYHEPVQNQFPKKNSLSVDYWGYFNNKANSGLIPGYAFLNEVWEFYPGADRSVDEEASKIFILESVTYPTGGTHTFEWEPHHYGNDLFQSYYKPETVYIGDDYEGSTEFCNIAGSTSPVISEQIREFPLTESTQVTLYAGSYGYHMDLEIGGGGYFAKLQSWNGTTWMDVLAATYTYAGNEVVPSPYGTPAHFEKTNQYTLAAGQYRMILKAETDMCTYGHVTYNDVLDQVADEKAGGGFRIKRILVNEGASSYSKEYDYGNGILFSPPVFAYDGSGGGSYMMNNGSWSDGPLRILSSSSITPLSASQGSFVGYGIVNETTKSIQGQANGRVSYMYYNFTETFTNDRQEPFHQAEYDPWRGKLQQVSTYDAQNNPLLQQTYTYEEDPNYLVKTYGFTGRTDWKYHHVTISECSLDAYETRGYMLYYELRSPWLKLVSDETVQFDVSTGASLSTIKEYEYNTTNWLPSHVTTHRSQGNTSEQITEFASATSTELGSDVLRSAHMISMPIRQTEKVAGNIVKKTETSYEQNQGNVVPADIFEYPDGTANGVIHTGVEYDIHGNVAEVLYLTGREKYIWSYDHTKPVIKAVNPTTGFEATVESSSVLPGGYATLESLVLSLDDIATDPVQQARWRSYNQSLRARPENAGMLIYTYTYRPLVGVTSETDSNSITRYYEYDNLGRLLWVKDNDGNILKTYEYNYKQ